MLELLAQSLMGFSLVAGLLLLAVYWFIYPAQDQSWLSHLACSGLLLGLMGLQYLHLAWLQGQTHWLESPLYIALLFTVAPCFYLFSHELLELKGRNNPMMLLNFLPLPLGLLLPQDWAIPLSFLMGTGYALCVCISLLKLRAQRQRFQLEMTSFIAFGVIAATILALGLSTPLVGAHLYVVTYGSLIGLALAAVIYLQLRFPDLLQRAQEAVAASYVASTLRNLDTQALCHRLKQLLEQEHIYRDENLSLTTLAELLGISSHQTSELINTQFDQGFSRLIRHYRVEEARRQLIDEPKASVLSIGLAAGFSSQSNFYAAFREITGETPGQFRKRQGILEPE